MPRTKRVLASDLSLAEIRNLLAAKERMVGLEEKKAKLEEELAAVNAQLGKLTAAGRPGRKPGRKPGRPATKKAGRRAAKKAGRPAAKKAGRPAAKKAGRPAVKKAPRRASGKVAPKAGSLQDVIVKLIRANGKPMEFKAILAAIKKGKLVKTKSKDFSNVLRRTLSTSTAVKRVARATYGV